MNRALKIIVIFSTLILLISSIYVLWLASIEPSEIENVNADNEGIKAGLLYLFKSVIRIISIVLAIILLVFYFLKKKKYAIISFVILLIAVTLTYLN